MIIRPTAKQMEQFIIRPTPKQREASRLANNHTITLFGGA